MSVELHEHIHSHVLDQKKHDLVHSKKFTKLIDKMVMVVGIISPLTALPQIYQIVETGSAEGVSSWTWGLWIIIAIFWLLYGIAHKAKPIIINNALWIFFEIVILSLTIIYS